MACLLHDIRGNVEEVVLLDVIREADDKDIPKLVEIAELCFPHSVYWSSGNQRAYRRWEFSIQSEASEVWIYETTTGIQGFSLNILNEPAWISVRKLFDISKFEKLVLLLRNPEKGYFSIRNHFGKRHSISLSESHFFTLAPRLFIDLFAVTPNSRGKGIAGALLAKNIERAEQLGRKAVAYNVDKNNLAMLGLMKKHGYSTVAGSRKQVTLARKITPSDYH